MKRKGKKFCAYWVYFYCMDKLRLIQGIYKGKQASRSLNWQDTERFKIIFFQRNLQFVSIFQPNLYPWKSFSETFHFNRTMLHSKKNIFFCQFEEWFVINLALKNVLNRGRPDCMHHVTDMSLSISSICRGTQVPQPGLKLGLQQVKMIKDVPADGWVLNAGTKEGVGLD